MDAKEQLRRYLEQRREMGETDLVLDTMTVDEAMRLLSGGGARGARSEERVARPSAPAEAPPAHVLEGPPPVERDYRESQLGGDWRAALRAAGAAPDSMPNKTAQPSAKMEQEIVPESFAVPKFESLDEIAKHVASCTKCPLYSTALNPVPGEGNPNADLSSTLGS